MTLYEIPDEYLEGLPEDMHTRGRECLSKLLEARDYVLSGCAHLAAMFYQYYTLSTVMDKDSLQDIVECTKSVTRSFLTYLNTTYPDAEGNYVFDYGQGFSKQQLEQYLAEDDMITPAKLFYSILHQPELYADDDDDENSLLED